MRTLWLPIAGLLTLTGCTADDLLKSGVDGGPEGAIAFSAPIVDESAPTRGAVTDLSNLGAFAVSAVVTDSQGPKVYFSHEKFPSPAEGSAVSQTESGETFYWLSEEAQYDFYAYSHLEASAFAPGEVSRFSFTVAEDVASQQDVVVCAVEDAPYGKRVPLTFKHPLARITVSESADIAEGRIDEISFSGIIGKGEYDMSQGEWTTSAADTTTYTFACNVATTPSASLTATDYNFFLIPQQLCPEARINITYADPLGYKHLYSAPLTGKWEAGSSYNYSIGIDNSLRFLFEAPLADAAYSIQKVVVEATGIDASLTWHVEATASDGAAVSVQWQKHANKFALMGFWTDRYITDGKRPTSARGSASTPSMAGRARETLLLFLPENVSQKDRTITLTAYSGSKELGIGTIVQKCAARSGSVGWEQLDDGETSNFGFCWDRSIAYVLPYSVEDFGAMSEYDTEDVVYLMEDLRTFGVAAVYTSILTYGRYYVENLGWLWHYYYDLAYADCNSLDDLTPSDGIANTRALFARGGTAATGVFELMLQNATYSGKQLFRLPDPSIADEADLPQPQGLDNLSLSALCKVLKKNKYEYVTTNIDGAQVEYPRLQKSEILWGLPAYEQFASLPTEIVDPVVPSQCWSSTPVAGRVNARLGNGAIASRSALHSVRAIRKF